MNQGGLKHAATDSRLDSKRERRRGASGRAAVLRRAPSDSDCSGETASLSADSGDRAVRPPPPPTRAAKSRSSRRRGSEWEVLEGLKDGQRFEKRPDVFNGYLHKKRKWPLKGWHKRFFVVDGGILVYARSPTDVARGRLHGSVDVGLSVISAKARRRRIDIDADEFIYHLRAKTPDVFRTWLNVLKAHRLYRQHLLTFGARESVPKIHAPLEDLPPTDTSSRSSQSLETTTYASSEDSHKITKKPFRKTKQIDSNFNSQRACGFTCANLQNNANGIEKLNNGLHIKNKRLCSMNCVTKFHLNDILNKSQNVYHACSTQEKQMLVTDLDSHSYQVASRYKSNNLKTVNETDKNESILTAVFRNKIEPACYFFSKKKSPNVPLYETPMKRSRKSTNLIKYRNRTTEPKLTEPLNSFLLLKNHKLALHESKKRVHKDVGCPSKQNNEATVEYKEYKASQDVISVNEYDKITERIMALLFEKNNSGKKDEIEYYMRQVVEELYDAKFSQTDLHPVKLLFRSLLEYWVKDTNDVPLKDALKQVKSVGKPSHNYFTRDKLLSTFVLKQETKQTQLDGMSDSFSHVADIKLLNRKNTFIKNKIDKKRSHSSERDTLSLEKERRVQEIETILKNTVYVSDTDHSNHSNDKDIKITKELLDNLDKLSKKFERNISVEHRVDNSQSSSEYPKIQETINRLISDNAIPADIAKEFLNAYLCILKDSNKSMSSDSSRLSEPYLQRSYEPQCEVVTESVQKSVSKSVITSHLEINKKVNNKATNQDVISNETDLVTMSANKHAKKFTETIESNDINTNKNRKSHKNLMNENPDDQAIVIDMSKYNLEQIYMHTNPAFNDVLSLSIQLTERAPYLGESKTQEHILIPNTSNITQKAELFSEVDGLNKFHNHYFNNLIEPNGMSVRIHYNFDKPNDTIDLKPYFSTSDASSKAYCKIVHESEHSIDMSCKSSNFFREEYCNDEDTQSCYIVSSFKKSATTKMQSTKNASVKRGNGLLSKDFNFWPTDDPSSSKYERTAPRVIDEQFILLLLENLALLSKNLPSLHKELNTFYLKLKKKYDKTVRHGCNIQGLSLLGKIYNEDDNYIDCGTQIDKCYCECSIDVGEAKIYKDALVITNDMTDKNKPLNKCVSTCNQLYEMKTVCVQTEPTPGKKFLILDFKTYESKNKLSKEYTCLNQAIRHRIHENGDPMQKSTSVQKWYEAVPTRDCGISTIITTVLNADNYKTFENVIDTTEYFFENKKTIYDRIEFVNESRKTPRLQIEKRNKDKDIHKEFNVYRLIVSKNHLRLSNPMIGFLISNNSEDLKTIYRCHSESSYCSGLISPTSPPLRGPQAGFVSGTPGGRLAGWIIESGGPLESASRELGQAQLSVQQLQRLLEALELQHQTHHDTDVSLEGASPNVKKDRRKFGLRKKKSNSKCASVELAPPHIDPSNSHMALSALTAPPSPGGGASSVPNSAASLPIACAAARPQSLPGAESLGGAAAGPASLTSLTPDHQLREDFTVLAKDLVTSLKSIVSTLVVERGRLRAAVEAADSSSPGTILAALRTNLSSALHQNSELRSRLSRIHDASDLAEISSMGPNSDQQVNRPFQQSLSYSSSCVSASEFFDAEEHDDDLKPTEIIAGDEAGVIELDGDSSSEAGSLSSEEGGSASSDNSEGATEQVTLRLNQNGIEPRPQSCWSRRTSLPCPRPTPGGPSLWNLLYKNIGKDLSQISMPVTINEPLNMLQRLCEELEYSELLDAAAGCASGVERMCLVAAFAVSAYAASAHRAASKPFNPLLAETYECVRTDRGFRFLAEQVSHHPPISACHAESSRWCFWQEARIKTKFWGKSMEFQPAGRVHVRLATTGDHYSWNKVTTCVHNLFGGQRWVDQYGDMHITCHGTDITCKLNFIKASSWSSTRHEVRGAVTGSGTRLRLQGRWSEALYAGEPPAARCLWRPGAMPPDHELYYGFTRFAMELNELEPGMREILPHTDTRLRPDQRALEEGNVEAAEQLKHDLEQAQRERRRDNPDHVPAWFRKSTENGEEMWVFTGEYWKARDAGFVRRAPAIW